MSPRVAGGDAAGIAAVKPFSWTKSKTYYLPLQPDKGLIHAALAS
jgi:hypothetical protein